MKEIVCFNCNKNVFYLPFEIQFNKETDKYYIFCPFPECNSLIELNIFNVNNKNIQYK